MRRKSVQTNKEYFMMTMEENIPGNIWLSCFCAFASLLMDSVFLWTSISFEELYILFLGSWWTKDLA